MQHRTKRLRALATIGAAILAVSACGSSTTSSSKPTTSAPGTAAPAVSTSSAVQTAEGFVAPYSKAPTSIGLKDKLTKSPGAGKTIVFITCEQPTCSDFTTGFKSAAAQFHWKVTPLIASSGNPAANAQAMAQAIALKPSAIVITGGNVPTWKHGLDAAKAANIPVFGTSMEAYPLGPSTGLYASVPVNVQDRTFAGKLMGNWIVAGSKAKANVLEVNIPELKIPESPYTQVTDSVLAQACPTTCKHATLDVAFADVLAGKAPSQIVSYLQSHPDVKYVNMAGGFETGVSAALKAAGLSVKLLDASSNLAVEQGVKSGEYSAALGFNALLIGWYAVNAIARHFAGLPAGDSATASLPTQILTPTNITTPANYQEPADYQQQFRALWGL